MARGPGRWLVAGLVLGAVLLPGVAVAVAHLRVPSAVHAYLLYPRQRLCDPLHRAAGDSSGPVAHQATRIFRPVRSAGAVMPPQLGERLGPDKLRVAAQPAS